jgi:acetyl esterase/lipase
MTADDMRAQIREIGNTFSPETIQKTIGLFAPHVARPTPEVCDVERDLSYGPDARHRLDIFKPKAVGSAARPALIFVHGGGFVGGDKGAPEAAFYNNVGVWAASQGFVGVTVTYRLAPGAQWPAGAEDLERAIAWLKANGAAHGIDPNGLVLMGQSAGGAHVASYVARAKGRAIAGAVLVSGLYDLTSLKHGPMEGPYYGTDPARYADQSSLAGLVASEIPLVFTVSEFDPPTFQQQAERVVEAFWAAKGVLPRLLLLPDQNHLSSITQIGSPFDAFGGELAAFVRRVSGSE